MATAALDDGDDALATPPSTQLELATQHDRYRLLLGAFHAWQRRAQAQCARRKQVAAACRVGSIFCQRVFWTRWRAFVVERRQLRREETKYMQAEDERLSRREGDADNGEFIDLNKEEKLSIASSDADSDQDESNTAILLRKRQYLKRLKLVIKNRTEKSAVCTNGVKQVRSLHAIRRWHGLVRVKKEHDVLQQQAYFFLYYWLLKRSLNQLGRYALVKKRDRALTVKIAKASRQRLLVKAMQQWRLRLVLHQTFTLWRSYVGRRRHQALLYRPIADALKRKTRRRLLQLTFGIWEKRHTRNRAQQALVHILDCHLYRKLCERVWKTWKNKVHQLVQVESFQRRYQERTLRRIWNAWSARTREKELRERQRRRAVRHCYLSLLRKGFYGFRAWHTERQRALNRVDTMHDAADFRMMALAFSRWDHFTSDRKLQAHKSERARHHYESRLLKHVWLNGFQRFYSRTLEKKKKIQVAQEHSYTQAVKRSFFVWKNLWRAERYRDHVLDEMMQQCVAEKERVTKSKILENWSEFSRAKAARRVVNAQVRGQAQRRTLQKYLSQWITYVSVLRWQQITQARAEQHYKSVIWRKCLERWRQNVALRHCYRNKTRKALVHWKLTLQRKVFDGWKQYLQFKRMKQHRIHEALEFRHEQFVREGLRHWMTAALYLQEQREQQVERTQASNTTHAWRRVAAIARHWRYLAIRRRAEKAKGQILGTSRSAPRRVQEDLHWQPKHQQKERTQYEKPSAPQWNENTFRQANVASDNTGRSNWTNDRSPLSEFVMLPRNRPQPRRPIEILLSTETENLPRVIENANTNEVVRCGLEFPVELFALLNSPSRSTPASSHQVTMIEHTTRECSSHPTPVMPSLESDGDPVLSNTTARQLDILERRLLALSQRKREWKASQQQLDAIREEAESNPRLMPNVRVMEEQHAIHTKRWLHTKERIRSLASEIQHLRRILQR
ncbi:hypothetical protein F443_04267 [Phytophthora nicotianae P1569]|uniref:Sfi1 spindle body domain-containing protein n=2 Tax=Phytophthora nicotianae P1569 TaxID=1317065 RepID=V9FNJ6_PHYNI|nr:hypothetical protein F443_04267 [Phytophthora nicotianae P1569]